MFFKLQKKKIIKLNVIFFLISIIISIYLLGLENLNPLSQSWLTSGDLSTYQLGWKYFRHDEWRFPVLSNPNYGIYLNGNLIYSDSIPLFALFFKIFNSILPNNIQYFSFWFIFCFYLQGIISFLILLKITKSEIFSFIGSVFFLFSTILIHRSAIHLSLIAHWIILLFFYIELCKSNKRFIYQNAVILLSISIHFYFTLILLIIFFISQIYDFLNKKKIFKKILIEASIIIISCLTLMYVFGYFSIKVDDGLGWGYGFYNLNLNSFFNPLGKTFEIFNWSNFIERKKINNGEIEGFSYLGTAGIIFFIFYLKFIFYEKKNIIFEPKKILYISLVLFLIALSNNINLGETNIIFIELNNYLYGLMSLFRASGRFIWPVYYLIFFIGIVSIYFIFPKKKFQILIALLFFQLLDISSGLKNYYGGKQFHNFKINDDNTFWQEISLNFENLRLLEPKNQSKIFSQIAPMLIYYDFKSTDAVYFARINRQLVIDKKYEIKKNIIDKNFIFFEKTIFVSDNLEFVRFLSYNYNNDIYIYEFNGLWYITKVQINELKSYLKKNFVEIFTFNANTIQKLPLLNSSILKLGFITDKKNDHLILDGEYGVLNFIINGKRCKNDSSIILEIDSYYNDKNINIDISINQINKNYKNQNKKIEINFNCIENVMNTVKFKSYNSLSAYDINVGLNREKRSLIIKSILIN